MANVAAPDAFVDTDNVPPSEPPPEAIAAVTVTPACATSLPNASRNCTTGAWVNTAAFTAVAGVDVVSARTAGGPEEIVMVAEVTGVSPADEKASV